MHVGAAEYCVPILSPMLMVLQNKYKSNPGCSSRGQGEVLFLLNRDNFQLFRLSDRHIGGHRCSETFQGKVVSRVDGASGKHTVVTLRPLL